MWRRALFAVLLSAAALCAGARSGICVVDSAAGLPVAGATVLGCSGIILGTTDSQGCIGSIRRAEYPLSVRCVGYAPAAVHSPADTVWLCPSAYALEEVVVTPADRPVLRVVCYAREYSSGITGTDTLQLYSEYMTESFIARAKVKGYRRADARPAIRGERRYGRIARQGTDSLFMARDPDDVTALSWFSFLASLPKDKVEVPEAIRQGAGQDSVAGRYGTRTVFTRRSGSFVKTTDMLADHKDRRWSPWLFKLLGLTIDINAGWWSLAFRANQADAYSVENLTCATFNISMTGRGRWLRAAFGTRQPIEMDTYIELYPLQVQRLTREEYMDMRREPDSLPICPPAGLVALSPAVERMAARIGRMAR